MAPVLEFSRPCPWPRDALRTVWRVLGLKGQVLGLGDQVLGIGFDHGVSVMSTAVRLKLDHSTRSTAGSSKWLYYRACCMMDALNCVRRDAVHMTFEMLTWINMAFDLCAKKTLYVVVSLWHGILQCVTGLAKCNVSIFSISETNTFRQR